MHELAFPFQVEGALKMAAHRRIFNADDQGIGKTLEALMAAEHALAPIEKDNPSHVNALVIAPAKNIATWEWEIEKWCPMEIRDWFELMTYNEAVENLQSLDSKDMPFQCVIIDEAKRLKDPFSERTKVIYNKVTRVRHVWPMDGTPMPNGPHEVWTHLYCLRASLLPQVNGKPIGYQAFKEEFCQLAPPFQAGLPERIIGLRNPDKLREIMAPFFFRRTPEEVGLQMPEVLYGEIAVRAEPLDLVPINRACRDLIVDEDGMPCSEVAFATARRMIGLLKAEVFGDWLAGELQDNPAEKYVVFAWHPEALDIVMRKVAKLGAVKIDGSTPPADVGALVHRFQNAPDCRVFLGQIVAAGTGHTLTAARNLIFLERSWSPGDNDQAMKRIKRIGQQASSVLVRDVMLRGSIDETVMRINRRKEAMISVFI